MSGRPRDRGQIGRAHLFLVLVLVSGCGTRGTTPSRLGLAPCAALAPSWAIEAQFAYRRRKRRRLRRRARGIEVLGAHRSDVFAFIQA